MRKLFYSKPFVSFLMMMLFTSVLLASSQKGYEEKKSAISYADRTAIAIYYFFNDKPDFNLANKKRLSQFTANGVKAFYMQRNYKPVWSEHGYMLPIADEMINVIKEIDKEGLNPNSPDYHLSTLHRLLDTEHDTKAIARADILLSDAFFTLGHHLYTGMAVGMNLNQTSKIGGKSLDISRIFQEAIDSNLLRESLMDLSPKHPEFLHLKKELAYYRAIKSNGGWDTRVMSYLNEQDAYFRRSGSKIHIETISIKEYETLEASIRKAEKTIEKRLAATGDFVEGGTLIDAIIRFQKRHGISADGIVGNNTALKMAIPVEKKIEMIRLNMERWRWMPRNIPDDYIIVNIPDFTLRAIEKRQAVFSMPVIVGKESRKTPAFSAEMQYLVFNPYWRIPKTILKQDIVPKIKRDIDYLEQKNIKIFSRSDVNERHPIDPHKIDWQTWKDNDRKRYLFRQEPGTKNPLGNVKFIFPNKYDVYIHDTPSRGQFNNGQNLLSSGCIRINDPVKLAAHLMKEDFPNITPGDISYTLSEKKTQKVTLSRPMPVYITYQTAWAHQNGLLNFRKDVYHYDTELASHLKGTSK